MLLQFNDEDEEPEVPSPPKRQKLLNGLTSVEDRLRLLYEMCSNMLQQISLPAVNKSWVEDQVWALNQFIVEVIQYVSVQVKSRVYGCAYDVHALGELCKKVKEYVSSLLQIRAEEEMVSK